MKKIKLVVKEDHLLAMVKAFNDYGKLMEPIVKENPGFQPLYNWVCEIQTKILCVNKYIHRKYDSIELKTYVELELENIEKQNEKS